MILHICLHADGTARVTDLGTPNGTFVDGERVETLVVSTGDEVVIAGVCTITLRECRASSRAPKDAFDPSSPREPHR